MVMEVVQEDMGEGNMQCTDHPYKNSTPGGICAFCLQEKLGKLVSSSFPVAVFPSSSSSSSPSFRSDFGGSTTTAAASTLAIRPNAASATSAAVATHSNMVSYGSANHSDCDYNQYYARRSKLMFLSTHRKKKKKEAAMAAADSASIVFKRSKSTTTPRRGIHFLEADEVEDYSLHKRGAGGFWSFLYLSSSKHNTTRKSERRRDISYPSSVSSAVAAAAGTSMMMMNGSMRSSREKKKEELVVVDENESPEETAVDRKVSRSRSVGCGSRSFSGDFFERISTGFGDCTLRRVESQREGKSKVHQQHSMHRNSSGGGGGQDCIKERVKCGGIFNGFMITSSSSSSSSSSYRVSSSTEDNNNNNNNNVTAKPATATATSAAVRHLAHGRSKSWGWAFASPMRAFGSNKPSNSRRETSNKNSTPNLAAIPSLLAVRS